jgi:hypothetical protein
LLSGWGSVPKDVIKNADDLLPTEKAKKEAVDQAYKRGYVTTYSFHMSGKIAGPFLGLRRDIDNYLDEIVCRECIENDAEIITAHGKEAFNELTTILKKSQERDDDRRYGAGLS